MRTMTFTDSDFAHVQEVLRLHHMHTRCRRSDDILQQSNGAPVVCRMPPVVVASPPTSLPPVAQTKTAPPLRIERGAEPG